MRYTIEHSWAVAAMSVKLGKALGMKIDDLITVFYSVIRLTKVKVSQHLPSS